MSGDVVDPTGRLVTLTRDAAGVAAITSRVRGGEKAEGDAPPYIVVLPIVPGAPGLAGGAGRRTRVMSWRHALRCYAPKVQGGDRQAVALGLAVMNALDMAGPITFPAPGGGSGHAGIYRLMVEGSAGPMVDPDTGEPYVVVTTYLAATGQSFT